MKDFLKDVGDICLDNIVYFVALLAYGTVLILKNVSVITEMRYFTVTLIIIALFAIINWRKNQYLSLAATGLLVLVFLMAFCQLEVPLKFLFVLLSLVWGLVAFFIPGAYTLTIFLLSHFNLIVSTMPLLIIAAVFDLIALVYLIVTIFLARRDVLNMGIMKE